jgi:hypothetical protein
MSSPGQTTEAKQGREESTTDGGGESSLRALAPVVTGLRTVAVERSAARAAEPCETTAQCENCHKQVTVTRDAGGRRVGLRKGLCRACYLRAWRGAALPAGAHCAVCPERRRALLRWTKLGEERVVTCHNCGFLVDHARPRPDSPEALERLLRRDRRGAERRGGLSGAPLDRGEPTAVPAALDDQPTERSPESTDRRSDERRRAAR